MRPLLGDGATPEGLSGVQEGPTAREVPVGPHRAAQRLVPEDVINEGVVAASAIDDPPTLRGYVAAALEAAAPLIVAAAFADLADDMDKEAHELSEENPRPGSAAFSVISVLVDVRDDLRARASVLRGEGQQ